MLSLFIILPLLFVLVLNLFPKKRAVVNVGFALTLIFTISQVCMVLYQPAFFWGLGDSIAALLNFKLTADNLTQLLLLSIGIVAFSSLLVAKSMFKDVGELFNFINLLLIGIIGMNATVMVSSLFLLYIFIEVTAIASFVLIALQNGKLALEGSFKYLVLSAVATVLMLTAIALIVLVVGDTSFDAVTGAFSNLASSNFVKLAVALFVCGLFIKAGIVPFHGWLPDAYSSAPSPTSVLLAGIVTKTSGVYVLIRLVAYVFNIGGAVSHVVMFVGAISILVGAFAAMGQNNFKRMLAYSSISQVGYIILALGCGTPLALAGAMFHFFNHAIFKTLLFVNASALESGLGTVEMDMMKGVASKMKLTRATSLIGFLSASGIPPLAGFWSKLFIVLALWYAGYFGYAILALLASVLTLAYFLIMQRKVFFCKAEMDAEVGKMDFWMMLPQVVLAFVIIFVGVLFPVLMNKCAFSRLIGMICQ